MGKMPNWRKLQILKRIGIGLLGIVGVIALLYALLIIFPELK